MGLSCRVKKCLPGSCSPVQWQASFREQAPRELGGDPSTGEEVGGWSMAGIRVLVG